ncbi:MAG: purine-nucleoside phosphorylase [Proteobacteria bacterium]|nr:purine-nucleoside phosphorylase [Pseudomonadota bacterium]MBU1640051.1 purine-nucleoside phosphorylase [Pseudomonadota bacterium]
MASGERLYREQVNETVSFLEEKLPSVPEIVIILGTGLGSLADSLENSISLDYEEIPHFPRSTVTSHAGKLLFGELAGKQVAVLQGRFHYYEGYSTRQITFPLRVLSLLGARFLLVSNAAGGLDPSYKPGTLMVISDHLNFIPDNPLRGVNIEEWGPRFPDLSQAYDPSLQELAQKCGKELGIDRMARGVYVAIAGPSLETPAETRYLRNCGADAVGMSTVPEVIVGIHAGLRILGIAMVANVNDPDNFQPILIHDILAEAKKAEGDFVRLIKEVVRRIK